MSSQAVSSSESKGVAMPTDLTSLTPAMRQYVEQKQRVEDAVLLFRMGDFYETFYDDAVLCSKVLGIALTSRSKGSSPIPLAGIPYHALEGYLSKLVAAGYKVAISEQVEDPKEAKGVVQREVVRIVTAGTLTDEALLDEHDDNLLAAVCIRGKSVGIASVELASGRFRTIDVDTAGVIDELVRLAPAEILIDDERDGPSAGVADTAHQLCGAAITRRPMHEFSDYQANKSLLDHFEVSTLAGFGFESMSASLCAAGCIIGYLKETQKTALGHITSIARRAVEDVLQIDHNSWRALEVDRTIRGGLREGSLLCAIDQTVHPIGARKLRHWLCAPLTNVDAILARQDAIGFLVESNILRAHLRKRLAAMADVERITARIALSRATPRDLKSLGRALDALPGMKADLTGSPAPFLTEIASDIEGLEEVAVLIRRGIHDEPAPTLREGGIIADGFDEELDRLRALAQNSRQWLADYQRQEIERAGVASLKVGFNRVFGYYIEISNTHRHQVPPDYVRKQTIKNAERYITDELKKFETEVLTAREQANEREQVLFEQVRREVASHTEALMCVADAIGRLDCAGGLAELSVGRRYVRPELVQDGRLEIHDGRHPVLDQMLADRFVPNDTIMVGADSRLFVITGPNMAGKSTYIRQVALIVLLAQTGSFVPAASMSFSTVDRVFTRVGASDELSRGQSTFMVEMTEAANILHNATDRSLVVLDELGRGTSTFDGLSLAWAITEHLANKTKCRALVATHYHELIELEELLRGVRNYNAAVKELPGAEQRDEGIAFLHRIVEGGASRSYGVHVAKLAGVPKAVVVRAREVLDELQRGFSRESHTPQLARNQTRRTDQLMLFRDRGDELLDMLRETDPDRMMPLDALQIIKRWKDEFGGA